MDVHKNAHLLFKNHTAAIHSKKKNSTSEAFRYLSLGNDPKHVSPVCHCLQTTDLFTFAYGKHSAILRDCLPSQHKHAPKTTKLLTLGNSQDA